MKKSFLFFFLLLAGGSGTALYCLRHAAAPAAGSEYYADYLPADTLAAVTLLDLHGMSKAFPESALGRFFSKPAMRAVMTEQGASEDAMLRYEEFADGAADLLTNPAIEQLFGDDLTFALLAPDMAHLKTEPEAELKRMLIAFGSSAAAESADRLASLALSNFSKETVSGLELTRILLDDNECLYGHAKDGVIILSYSPETIAAALRQKSAGGGLSAASAFAAAEKFWEERTAGRCHVKFYANPATLSRLAAASRLPEAEKTAGFLQSLQSLSGVAGADQDGVQIRSRATYARRQKPHLRQNNMSLHLLNDNTLFYGWVAGLSRSLLAAAGPAQYQAMDTAAQAQLGFSLQDLLEAAGPQAGIKIGELASIGLFPLPKLTLFAQIRETESARRLADRLRQKMTDRGFAEKITESGGHSIVYWNLLPPDAAHPALALTEQMLYFANGEAALKKVLAKEKEGRGLPQSPCALLGPELAAQFSEANSFAFLIRPALMAAAAQKTANWATAVAGMPAAEKLREELFKLVQPLDFAVGWSYADEDHADSVLVLRRNAV